MNAIGNGCITELSQIVISVSNHTRKGMGRKQACWGGLPKNSTSIRDSRNLISKSGDTLNGISLSSLAEGGRHKTKKKMYVIKSNYVECHVLTPV